MPLRPLLALVAMLLACACDDDLTAGAQTYTLRNGVRVEISDDGALELVSARGVDFATAPGTPTSVRSFVRSSQEFAGFFRFFREDELQRAVFFDGSRQTARAVELHFSGNGVRVVYRVVDTDDAEATHITVTPSGRRDISSTAIPLRCDADASFLGFGEQYELVNQRGEAFDLWVREQGIGRDGEFFPKGSRHDTYFPMPYFMDARGYGLVIDTEARLLVDLCKADTDVAEIEVETAAPIELVVLHGPTPKDVVRELGDRYGRPIAPESWAWGPWMAIQGGQQATLAEADALDAAMVPYTAIWAQDWIGRESLVGDFTDLDYHWVVNTEQFPDIAAMTANLHARGKRFLGYFNPFVLPKFDEYAPMAEANLLMTNADAEPYVMPFFKGMTALPDLTRTDTREFVAGYLRTAMETHGIDGWMCDFGEAVPTDAHFASGETGNEVHNRYPRLWQSLHHDTARALRGNDYAIFSRSGWLGSQGTTQIVWLGDQEADSTAEDGLPTVVPAMINLGLSGVPFVTHDIAGYSGGPSTKALFMRWTELGAFTPTMRTHEGLRALSNWSWDHDAETMEHFRKFARIHQALVPMMDTLAAEAAQTSMPLVRHMLLEFPNDPNVIDLDQQYMLGSTLLVAPIIHDADTSRTVYLPEGTWFHVFTGMEYTGPITLTVAAPMGEPPVFSRGVDRPDLRAIE